MPECEHSEIAGMGSDNTGIVSYPILELHRQVCHVSSQIRLRDVTFLRASAVAVKLAPTSNSAAVKMASVIRGH